MASGGDVSILQHNANETVVTLRKASVKVLKYSIKILEISDLSYISVHHVPVGCFRIRARTCFKCLQHG